MPTDLITLCVLIFIETILGIDNIIFIAVAVSNIKNPTKIRYMGLSLALLLRLLMLFAISFVLKLAKPIFYGFSVSNFLLILGGIFLLFKSIAELKADLINKKEEITKKPSSKIKAILQIAFIDLVFSFDSLMTAIGLTKNTNLIAISICFAVLFMAFASGSVLKYIKKFPELKILSLVLIAAVGIVLILEGLHIKIDKSYVYFAFFFSLLIEALNIKRRTKTK